MYSTSRNLGVPTHAGSTYGTCGSDMNADTICYDVDIDIRSYWIVKNFHIDVDAL